MNYPTNNPQINPLDQKDIDELSSRIDAFKRGKEDEERFKHYRLTRGVYGQRQEGVQMFRIKIPYGRLTPDQLERIADLSEEYTNARMHLTTRQNIQLHYVRLDDSPAIWSGLAETGMNAREACGNTVRTVTASATAGVHPNEPFDVGPYAQAVTDYFLRNPICQEMGRKIKMAFSATEADAAFTYFHDFGFIPRVVDGERGFRVVVGGGLGAVSMVAKPVSEFMPTDEILPFLEAAIRVFDRYGERQKRMKARMKFLIKSMGLETFLELVEEEKHGLANLSIPIAVPETTKPQFSDNYTDEVVAPNPGFDTWKATNVHPQKQKGFVFVQVRIPLGNLTSAEARKVADLVRQFAAADIRVTVNQGLLFRFVREANLPALYNGLAALGFGAPGFHGTSDVTACPGTDTCALGVTNSTGLADHLSTFIQEEYPDYVYEQNLRIKISGCMNSCGQHMAAQIGFHGSSIRDKKNNWLVPAMQVVLGGGVRPDGTGFIAQKVIKLPTRRIPQALGLVLDHYEAERESDELFIDFVQRLGKRHFYQLLKPLADTETFTEADLIDWSEDNPYRQSIGVGECAGAALDLVGTILQDAVTKRNDAFTYAAEGAYDYAAYYAYTALVVGAKALLLAADVDCNTHKGIMQDFQEHYVTNGLISREEDFPGFVLRIKKNRPTRVFVESFLQEASDLLDDMVAYRESQLRREGADKLVIENYYKA